ncbi:MAG TPA: polymer-forming cytoskeletal protein [Solirubrobacterales bacterium]|jgi:hypothetical protein
MRTSFALLVALLLFATPAAAAPLSGEADDDVLVVINGDVDVEPGELSKGVYIVEGDAQIRGEVVGDVVLVAGDVTIRGRVVGDVVTIAGRARVLPSGRVVGDLIYVDEPPLVAPRATVTGKTERWSWDDLDVFPYVAAAALWLAVTVSLALLGVLLLLLAPRAADAVFAQAQSRFWTAVGVGAGIFIALPLLVLVAAVTLVGLPLAIGIALALLPLAAIAYVATAWVLGRALVKPPANRHLSFLVGLAILRVVSLIPAVNVLVWLGAFLVGLGLLAAAIAATRSEPARTY